MTHWLDIGTVCFQQNCCMPVAQKNKLTFRSGHYTGRGWEVQEYAQLLKQGAANYGGQIGWYMVRSKIEHPGWHDMLHSAADEDKLFSRRLVPCSQTC